MGKKIWVLTDYRIGNSVQALAVAEGLGFGYEVKKLEYNFLAKLPNSMLPSGLWHVKQATKSELSANIPPDIIISSGRRCANIAKYLKSQYPNSKIIQILKPEIDLDIFDMLILPKHDKIKLPGDFKCKIIRTLGGMNNIADRIVKYKDSKPRLKNFIGILIGGDSKNYKYSIDDSKRFCEILSNISSNNKLPFFITFSRRTPEFMKEMLRDKFQAPHIIYDPNTEPENNPYIEILKNAKFLIITSDSVSMCSEAASSGKPLYIYSPAGFKSRKHNELILEFFSQNIAKPLDDQAFQLEEYEYTKLNECEKVIEYIKEHWL